MLGNVIQGQKYYARKGHTRSIMLCQTDTEKRHLKSVIFCRERINNYLLGKVIQGHSYFA